MWPNVRILVLGDLIADGTLWQPIRFKPLNATEFAQIKGTIPTQFRRRRSPFQGVRPWNKRSSLDERFVQFYRFHRRNQRRIPDPVYRVHPEIIRENPQYQ